MQRLVILLMILVSCSARVPTPDNAHTPSPRVPSGACVTCASSTAPEPSASDAPAAWGRTLSGRVLGAEGAVSGASVGIAGPGENGDRSFETTLTGPSGEFSVRVPRDDGYVLTAHHGHWGSVVSQRSPDLDGNGSSIDILLEQRAVAAQGVLEDEHGQPIAGGRIDLHVSGSGGSGEAFAVATDPEGRFEARLPNGKYDVVARAGGQATAAVSLTLPLRQSLELRLFRNGPSADPPTAEELAFLQKHRRPLGGDGAGVWTEEWLRDVQVVGLGEQTHGAREGIVARFELAKALIVDHGFNVVALEAGYEAAWKLGEWVRGKPGNVQQAVDALGMWVWQTQEMVEFATWLRAENGRRSAANAIELSGVYGYSEFPTKLEVLRERLAASKLEARSQLSKEVPSVRSCAELEHSFASNQRWSHAREQDPVLALMIDSIRTCDVLISASPADVGERFAADTSLRILAMRDGAARRPRKMVLLAHDGHVARERVGRAQGDIMGQHLSRALGPRYRAVGVTIGAGAFNGSYFHPKTGYAKGHSRLELDVIRPASLENVLDAGGPAFFLASKSPEGETWPGPARMMRNIGSSYCPPYAEHYWGPVLFQTTYDAIVYIPRTEPVVERPWGGAAKP